jgi:hypothetical protein
MLTENIANEEAKPQDANSANDLNQLSRLDKPSDLVKSLEAWYSSDFERRITALTELLQVQIGQQIREQFVTDFEARTESLRSEYEGRMDSQLEKWESDRKALHQEIDNLRQQVPAVDLRQEIQSIEDSLRKKEAALKQMMCDDSLPLGSIMEGKVERAELLGYLKALNFLAAGGDKKPQSAT